MSSTSLTFCRLSDQILHAMSTLKSGRRSIPGLNKSNSKNFDLDKTATVAGKLHLMNWLFPGFLIQITNILTCLHFTNLNSMHFHLNNIVVFWNSQS
jgi:hypothetical protein